MLLPFVLALGQRPVYVGKMAITPVHECLWLVVLNLVEHVRIGQGYPPWPDGVKQEIISDIKGADFFAKDQTETYEKILEVVDKIEWRHRNSITTSFKH